MDICLFSNIKPTWNILEFDEKIAHIPCVSREYGRTNPLDKDVVIRFRPEADGKYVYYLPRTNRTRVSPNCIYSSASLAEFFRAQVRSEYKTAEGENKCVRSFVYETVLGESYVFRKFELAISCVKIGSSYICRTFPLREVCRYVFYSGGFYMESRDKTMTFGPIRKMISDDVYDMLQDADNPFRYDLYQSFLKDVKMLHKAEMLPVLAAVKRDYCKLGFKVFAAIYAKAMETDFIEETVPKRIVRELRRRSHIPNTAVRIERDLVVVTGERECKYLDTCEQIRAYYDRDRGYYFRRNIVTGKWQEDDFFSLFVRNRQMKERVIDRDIFDHTCMEKYTEFSLEKGIFAKNKINYGSLVVQSFFLSAEQAAKTESNIYCLLLENIYQGKIRERNRSLPQLLGITGAQLKFLKDVPLPRNLESFAKCMEAEDFKVYFPDVKKRIFAVAFYLNGSNYWNDKMELTKEEVFAAARTLNALERRTTDGKELLLSEYRDYLKMYRCYQSYVKQIRVGEPLYQEILEFGEVPINIKPSRIREYHNKLGRIVNLMERSEQIIKYTQALRERKAKEAQKLEYTDGKYSILMPGDARDIIREGWKLQHCVGGAGYIGAMAENRCTILFLRNNRELETPLITIEEKDGRIRQCYGFRNTHNSNAEIRDFIKEYAALHHFKIDAVIFSDKM